MHPDLFLGYPIDSALEKALSAINAERYALFVNEEEIYLKKVEFGGRLFLGKRIQDTSNVPDLKLLEDNVYSLLKAVEPSYPFSLSSLVLFPVSKP